MSTNPPPLAGAIGTCESADRSYNLRRLMVLENQAVEIDGPSGPLSIGISGEHVQIRSARSRRDGVVHEENIADAVDPEEDLDVELKLGYLDGRLVVYWKETYRHRIYRQGLFHIVDERVKALCAGRGGVTVRD